MKQYLGYWNDGNRKIVVVEDDTATPIRAITRHPVLDWKHPLGWGYRGNAVLNAAYSILADCVGEERAKGCYQRFALEVLGRTPQQRSFELREQDILLWLEDRVAA